MRALGLGAKMDAERLSLTARRYADLMAASREGHAAADAEPATTLGGKKRKMVDGSDGSGETELVRDLELATLCEHHLLPFHGAARGDDGFEEGRVPRDVTEDRDDARAQVSGSGAPDARHRQGRGGCDGRIRGDGGVPRGAPVHDCEGGGEAGVDDVHLRVPRGIRERSDEKKQVLARARGGEVI